MTHSAMNTPVEVSWFSALCDDDYEFLGVPDPMLASSWEHCRNIVLAAEKDVIFNPAGYLDVFKPLDNAQVEILPELDHFQLATSDEVSKRIAVWLARKP